MRMTSGKYFGEKVSDMWDMQYLKWLLENRPPKGRLRHEIYIQIKKLEKEESERTKRRTDFILNGRKRYE